MKYILGLLVVIGVVLGAYFNANKQLNEKVSLKDLRLRMSEREVLNKFGLPDSKNHNVLIYILKDSSQLMINLREGLVASAMVRFHKPLRIEDPQLRKLTFVQISPGDMLNENPSWFFVGKPEDGLIYKITQSGLIESLTWVPPFTYVNDQPKNLQALLHDFKSQQVSNL